jgi:hypothetical protein
MLQEKGPELFQHHFLRSIYFGMAGPAVAEQHQLLPREQLVGSAQLTGATRAATAALFALASFTEAGVVFSMAPMTSAQTLKQATNSVARICDSNFMTSLRDWLVPCAV